MQGLLRSGKEYNRELPSRGADSGSRGEPAREIPAEGRLEGDGAAPQKAR